jgi:hypothetical protein
LTNQLYYGNSLKNMNFISMNFSKAFDNGKQHIIFYYYFSIPYLAALVCLEFYSLVLFGPTEFRSYRGTTSRFFGLFIKKCASLYISFFIWLSDKVRKSKSLFASTYHKIWNFMNSVTKIIESCDSMLRAITQIWTHST